jgi:sigma-E factor negative regulatory protein RseC
MLEEKGHVVAIEGHRAWVQILRQTACQSCEARKGCGQSTLAKMSGGKASQVLVNNILNLNIGDEVLLGISESAMVRASLIVYMFPLLVMVVVAVLIAQLFPANQLLISMGGLIGLAAGFGLVRFYSNQHQGDTAFEPQMIRKLVHHSPATHTEWESAHFTH